MKASRMRDHAGNLARALKKAADEHGRPNSFGCDELHRLYGGPRPMIAGRIGTDSLYAGWLTTALVYLGWKGSFPLYASDTRRFYL